MRLLVLVLVATVAACGSAFTDVEALFIGYNDTFDRMSIVVNGQDFVVEAKNLRRFTVLVPIPKNPVSLGGGYPTGPSAVDKTTSVSVIARNLRTGELSEPRQCLAGAKIVTSVYYNTSLPYVRCDYSY